MSLPTSDELPTALSDIVLVVTRQSYIYCRNSHKKDPHSTVMLPFFPCKVCLVEEFKLPEDQLRESQICKLTF